MQVDAWHIGSDNFVRTTTCAFSVRHVNITQNSGVQTGPHGHQNNMARSLIIAISTFVDLDATEEISDGQSESETSADVRNSGIHAWTSKTFNCP